VTMTTLHYYSAQGRAQQIRFALAEGGIDWTDDSAAYPPPAGQTEKWREIGGNLTTNVPMLVMDGKAYTQSSAVLRFAARKGGLMPKDEEEQYEVDNIIAHVEDFRTEAYKPIFPVLMGKPDADAIANFRDTIIPKHFANLERLLGDRDFFVGSSCTVADIAVFDVVNNFSFNLLPSTKAGFPKLAAFQARMEARPKMAAYMASENYQKLMAFPNLEA